MAPTDPDLIAHGDLVPMASLLLIGLGGFAGAVARYLLDGRIAAATGGGFPWGTLVINLSGSLAIACSSR